MPFFSRTQTPPSRDTAKHLISGYLGLTAYWALRHAGVIDAMLAEPAKNMAPGINVVAFASKTSMSAEVLIPLMEYAAASGLVTIKEGQATLTPVGKALRENEDGVLEMVRAYQPTVNAVEHLLARLKTYSGSIMRKSEAITESQSARYADEVYPAIEKAVAKCGATHVLDLSCGAGDLLLRLGNATKHIAGVGIGLDGPSIRKANDAVTRAGMEKRFIAVTGSPIDVCTHTRDAFERLGISTAFWEQVDCVVACNVFGELAGRDATSTIAALARLPRVFPAATIILVEATADETREEAYYAAEMSLLMSISRHTLLSTEQWRSMLATAGLKIAGESAMMTDSLTLFACSPTKRGKAAGATATAASPGA